MSMDTSPHTHRVLPVDVLTSGYRLVGKLMVGSNGVMGILNDATRSTVEIHDARLARLHMPTKLVDHFELARIMKRHVYAVCLGRREDLGPQTMVRGGYTTVTEFGVRVTTQMFEMEGVLEISGRFDFSALMSEGSREFIPIFNSVITAILIPNLRVESAAILVNRRQIDLLAQLNQRVKEGEKR